VNEVLLREARESSTRLTEAHRRAEQAKTEHYHAIRRLHLAGATLREIADALDISHQRVHQIIDATGGAPDWRHRRTTTDLACSFCGTAKADVTRLIAGPAVFICDGCVELARQVIADSRSVDGPRTRLDPVPSASALTCSFCAKPAADVGRLVAGPGVRVCDGCVEFCVEVIATTVH
jgi:hypothetical protein